MELPHLVAILVFMRILNFTFFYLSWLWLSFFVICCGNEGALRDEFENFAFDVEDKDDSLRSLSFRSQETTLSDFQENAADFIPIPAAYIVAFKQQVKRPSGLKESFLEENLRNFQDLNSEIFSDPRVSTVRYLAEVNLGSSGKGDPLGVLNKSTFSTLNTQMFGDRKQETNHPLSLQRVDFRSEAEAEETLKEWFDRGDIWYAEPDYENKLFANDFGTYSESYTALNQTWMSGIRLTEAFKTLSTSASLFDDVPIIAVMDTGVDYQHPQLANKMWQNDSVGNAGCGEDTYGCNTAVGNKSYLGNGDVFPFLVDGPNTTCPKVETQCDRSCCHGTHVAGIIAASLANGSKSAGVCPICRIMAIRVMSLSENKSPTIMDSSIIGGLKYVSRFLSKDGSGLAVRVINASFGKYQRSKTTNILIRSLSETGKGTIVIGAAGNEDSMKMQYPAAYKDAIAVASLQANSAQNATAGSSWTRLNSSNFGRWVDIAAPGSDIISTVPGNQTEPKSGTSMAAPVVAGLAGLLLSNNPDMTARDLRNALLNSADPTLYENSVNASYYPKIRGDSSPTPMLGTGLLNAATAIKGSTAANLPSTKPLDRVSTGCGSIKNNRRDSMPNIFLYLFGLLPILFTLLKTKKRKSLRCTH